VPEPAINGNAIGTTVPDEGFASDLKNSIPNTISNPRIKITIEPPTANDFTSTPMILRNFSPTSKNRIMKPPDIRVALSSRIPPIFCFRLINNGTEPMISITAKSVKVTVRNSSNEKFIGGKGREYGIDELSGFSNWRIYHEA
jgi:hypothetical protein